MIELKGHKDTYIADTRKIINTKGKVSKVFMGRKLSDNSLVMIKQINSSIIKKDDLLQFTSETKFDIRHPDIVSSIEHITDNKNIYIIRKYINGTDLKQAIRHKNLKKLFTVEFCVKCIIRVLESLSALHKQNIFHCDIKPSNIILAYDNIKEIDINNPEIKLIDLGMAKSIQHYKKSGISPFALIYSPPEQLLNVHSLINQYSDIYSTAITLYELITKTTPFNNTNPLILITLQLTYPLEKSKKIPDKLFDIIKKASYKYPFPKPPHKYTAEALKEKLIKGQQGRYADAEEFIEALKSL